VTRAARVSRPVLVRRDDWLERLADALAAAQTRAHAPGEHDCALNVADAIAAMTDVDIAARWRGRYTSEAEGMALLATELGTKTLAGAMSAHLKPVHPAFAERGDVALAMVGGAAGDAPTLMVFDGEWLRGPAGALASRDKAVRAWKVA
jgi:hypothetical protein